MPTDYDLELPQLLSLGNAAPEVNAALPLTQASVTPGLLPALTQAPSFADAIAQLGAMITQTAAPFARPGEREALMASGKLQQQYLEQKRQKKASDETQALTGLVTTALGSGDPKQLESVIKQMAGLKGLEPETVQALQKLQVGMAENLGKQQRAKQAMEAIPANVTGPRIDVVKALLAQGVEPTVAHSIASLIPEQKALEPFTLSKDQTRYMPNAQGSFNVIQGPEGVRDEIPPSSMVALEQAGVTLGGRTRIGQVSPSEWAKLNEFNRQARLEDKKAALEIAAQTRMSEHAMSPINEKAQYYVDPKTLQNPYPDMTRTELGQAVRDKRLVTIRPVDLQNLRDMRATAQQLLEMREIAGRLLSKNPGVNLIQAVRLAAARGLASSSDAQIFEGWGQAMSLKIAADFNKGRPSDKDQDAVRGLTFSSKDTVKTATDKIDSLIRHFDRVAEANLGVPIDPRRTGAYRPTIPNASTSVRTLEGPGW